MFKDEAFEEGGDGLPPFAIEASDGLELEAEIGVGSALAPAEQELERLKREVAAEGLAAARGWSCGGRGGPGGPVPVP